MKILYSSRQPPVNEVESGIKDLENEKATRSNCVPSKILKNNKATFSLSHFVT